jgi:alcohol dehydrogenase class IV
VRAAELLAVELETLCADLAVPTPAAFGIDQHEWRAKIPTMVEQALASGSPHNNPRIPTPDDIAAIYTEIFH